MADTPRIGVIGLPGKWSSETLADAVQARTGERLLFDMYARDGDTVRIDWSDGWVHVRPSQTEQLIRVISEAETEAPLLSVAAAKVTCRIGPKTPPGQHTVEIQRDDVGVVLADVTRV